METNLKKNRWRKIVIIILISIGSIFLLSGLTLYIILHGYISKMNLTGRKESVKEDVAEKEVSSYEKIVIYEEELEEESDESAEVDITEGNKNLTTSELSELEESIRKNMENNRVEIMKDKKVLNILLIGSDTRNVKQRGRSDSMILVSINRDTKKIIATSLLRDIYLKIPGRSNNRLNSAYAYGGADLLMDTIEQNFKIEIDKYISVDFYSFIDIVDAIGGITLEVKENEIKSMNKYIKDFNLVFGEEENTDCINNPGTYLLNGKQALSYARNRYTTNGDFDRTLRQRKVLEQIFIKVKGLNLIEMNQLLNIVLPQVTTNFTEGEIFAQILSLPAYINYDLEQWSVPVQGSYKNVKIRGMSVLGIDFEENINQILTQIYLTE